MDVFEWLENNAGGFNALSNEKRFAPMHFSLLWSYFEAEALGANGSSAAIETFVRNLEHSNRLSNAAFTPALNYFKDRYYSNGQFTPNFDSLNLRGNDNIPLVQSVLSGNNKNLTDATVVLFIIIYRFRNNYFHGPKWADHMQGQLTNFNFANQSIMAILEMSR